METCSEASEREVVARAPWRRRSPPSRERTGDTPPSPAAALLPTEAELSRLRARSDAVSCSETIAELVYSAARFTRERAAEEGLNGPSDRRLRRSAAALKLAAAADGREALGVAELLLLPALLAANEAEADALEGWLETQLHSHLEDLSAFR